MVVLPKIKKESDSRNRKVKWLMSGNLDEEMERAHELLKPEETQVPAEVGEIIEFLCSREFINNFILQIALVPHFSPLQDDPHNPTPENKHNRDKYDENNMFGTFHLNLHKISFTITTYNRP